MGAPELNTLPEITADMLRCECATCDAPEPNSELIRKLNMLQNQLRIPLRVKRGTSCREANKRYRAAATNSAHLHGLAADIYTDGLDLPDYIRLLSLIHGGTFETVGFGQGYVHVDIREIKL